MNGNEVADSTAERIAERKQAVALFQKNKQKVTDLLNNYQSQIANSLPSMMKPQVVIQAAITSMMKKPELMECTGHSLISCVLTASQLGLMFDDFLGEGYLIPFNNSRKGVKECQFIPGYRGLCKLARNSGQVKSIKAVPVYEGDKFYHEEGLNDRLEHTPSGEENPDKITHVYAIIKYLNGGYEFVVVTRKKIEQTRDESKNYIFAKNKAETVWAKHFEDMAKKTAVRRLLKMAPLSAEVSRALAIDDAADMGLQNLSIDWANELTGMAEDIEHELVAETEGIKAEATAQKVEFNKETSQVKAASAIEQTQNLLNKKIGAKKPK